MTEVEIVKLFGLIRIEYPQFENHFEKQLLWNELLKDMSFEHAVSNLKIHMLESEYAPKLANIVRRDPDSFVDYEKLKRETRLLLDGTEERRNLAIACPPHIKKLLLKDGDPD